MKLLIVTQTVDSQDPILGFFHSWIEEFAKHCDRIVVIAQRVGQHKFPSNITVLSLGKEAGVSRASQVLRFWRYALAHRSEYDRVFVHMTPIWVLLGAPMWILLRKPIYLWYEIKRGSWKLSAALAVVRKVFAASKHGLPSVVSKQVTVGHGIDTVAFVPKPDLRESHHLVAVGRVTAIKHYEVLLRALAKLPECKLTIAGGTVTESDKQTEADLRSLMCKLNVQDRVEMGWVNPSDMPLLLQRADCMVHASQGGLDKVVLQAMACGCPVVSTSEAAHSVLPDACRATPDTLAEKTQAILALGIDKRQSLSQALRSTVEHDHSLSQCVSSLVSNMQ